MKYLRKFWNWWDRSSRTKPYATFFYGWSICGLIMTSHVATFIIFALCTAYWTWVMYMDDFDE